MMGEIWVHVLSKCLCFSCVTHWIPGEGSISYRLPREGSQQAGSRIGMKQRGLKTSGTLGKTGKRKEKTFFIFLLFINRGTLERGSQRSNIQGWHYVQGMKQFHYGESSSTIKYFQSRKVHFLVLSWKINAVMQDNASLQNSCENPI